MDFAYGGLCVRKPTLLETQRNLEHSFLEDNAPRKDSTEQELTVRSELRSRDRHGRSLGTTTYCVWTRDRGPCVVDTPEGR